MSKKLLMAIAGVIAALANDFLGVDPETSMQVLAVIISYIVGQGIADKGKEAVKEGAKQDKK